MSKGTKYIVAETGKNFRGVIIAHGTVKDLKTGETYPVSDLEIAPKSSMLSKLIHFNRIGLCMYAHEYWKYKTFYLYPALTVEVVNGYDHFADFEIKLLCFGIGMRFIWIKKH